MKLDKQLRAVPSDFSRVGSLGALNDMGWQKIPSYYYDVTQYRLPLTTEEFNLKFGGDINVFNLDEPVGGHQTNAAIGSTVNEIFLAMGVGVVAIGEGEAFALPGLAVDRPPSAVATPKVADLCGSAAGCNTGLVIDDPPLILPDGYAYNPQQSVFWYGGPTWRFIEKFFQAYRLNLFVNRRFMLVDESLFDVGMLPVPPEFIGASSSELSAMPFIQEVNEVMAGKNLSKVFLPQNTSLIIDDAGNIDASLQGAPPIAGVTYGSNRIVGLSNRIFSFCQPILFAPGMRFDIKFSTVENDVAFKPAMKAISTLNPAAGTLPDTLFSQNVSAADGEGATVDATDAFGNDILAGVFTVPGGTVSLGLVFKGVALQPQACLEYLSSYLNQGMIEGLYAGNDYLSGLIRKYNLMGSNQLGRLLKEK